MSLIDGVIVTQLVVFYLLVVAMNVVSQDTSQDQLDMDVFVPVVTKMMTAIVCQGNKRNLSCSNTSMVLVINKALYGRDSVGKTICPYNPRLEKEDTDDKKVGCEEDVKLKLRKICQKRKTCQLSATKKVLGRPCKGIYKYLQIIYACATKEEFERSFNLSSNTTSFSSPSPSLAPFYTTPTSRVYEQSSSHASGDSNASNPFTRAVVADTKKSSPASGDSNVSNPFTRAIVADTKKSSPASGDSNVSNRPFTRAIVADSLPVYVPKNLTVNVTKPNVTKSNVTQSNTTVPPTLPTTSNRTMPLNTSCKTSYRCSQAVTSAVTSTVPFLPSSSTGAKTVDDEQSRTNNSSSYIAVFVITSVCAAIILGGVFARCWYLRRRTKSQTFAVLHKPKRFFEPPRQLKQSNGHAGRRASHDINMNKDLLAEDRPMRKNSDLVFTKADIESTPRHKQQIQGLVNKDEADAPKGDNSTFYVNPMYDKNRQNSTASAASAASSHPRTQPGPHRLSNASDSKTGVPGSPARTLNKQQKRCNSMGNIPRSSHSGMQRRHPSAGNVAANKDMYQYPQQQTSFLYNAPQIKAGNYQDQGQGNYQGQGQGNYQGQGQGNYQGQGQGSYQGQQRGPMNQSPARHGPHPSKNPMNQRPNAPQQGSPTKTPQRNRPSGPGGATTYPSPGHQGRKGNRPNSPYEYGSTEKDPLMEGRGYPGSNDPNTARYNGNTPGEIGITVNPASSQGGPMQYRSNGPMPSREGRQPFDPAGNPHIEQLEDVSGYGKIRSKPPVETLSPLDVTQADPRFLGAPNSDSHSFRPNTYEGRRSQMQYPAPPDQGSDSSEDDLYSIVAKGNYDSVINDPLNVQQTFRSERKKHRNPSGHASRTSSRNYVSGRDTSV